MKCKFCRAEMEEGSTVCPICGKGNGEKPTKKAKREKTALPLWASICIGVLTAAVVALGTFAAMQLLKDPFKSYTASASKLEKAKDRVVATVGDKQLTNAELQVYYWVYVYSFIDENGSYLTTLGFDYKKDFAKQECSVEKGISWQQYFLKNALDAWHQYAVMNIASEGTDYELSEDEQKYLDNLRETMDKQAKEYGYKDGADMIAAEMGAGATFDAYIKYTVDTFKGMGYYEYLCENLKFTEEEIAASFEKNKDYFAQYGITKDDKDFAWTTVRHILLQPVGTTGADGKVTYTDADWEACKQKAEALLNSYLTGKEVNEEAFIALAKEHSEDDGVDGEGGSKKDGGLIPKFFRNEMVKPFEEWSFDKTRVYGDTGLVKSDYGYHIMFFVEAESQWHYYSDAELRYDAGQAKLDEFMEANPIRVEDKKILLGHVALG